MNLLELFIQNGQVDLQSYLTHLFDLLHQTEYTQEAIH